MSPVKYYSRQEKDKRILRDNRLTGRPSLRPGRHTTHGLIALNHLGFLPKGRKRVIFRLTGQESPAAFTMREIGSVTPAFSITRPLTREPSDLGECLVGDFSDVERVGNEDDEPLLDMEYGSDWHTTEYWQPHNAWYLWTRSVLEEIDRG